MKPNPRLNLIRAAQNGDVDTVRTLLDAKEDVDQLDANVDADSARRLLRNYSSGGVEWVGTRGLGSTALMRAAARSKVAVIELLVKHGANLELRDALQRTALMVAIEEERGIRAGKALIAAGADVNAVNAWKSSILSQAIEERKPKLVPELLRSGAKPDPRCPKGWKPLSRAADKQDVKSLRLLLDNGADPNKSDAMSRSVVALPHTIEPNLEMLALLIQHGGDVNLPISGSGGRGKSTLLIHAIRYAVCDDRLVKLLVDAGADQTIADSDGNTAVDEARKENRQDIELLLNSR